MDIAEYRLLDNDFRNRNPGTIEMFDWYPPADEAEVTSAEERLGAKLPRSYREFLQEFGSGVYVFCNLFSLNCDSDWFLFKEYASARKYGLPPNLLPFSDDYCGGYYAFMRGDAEFLDPVYYWHFEDGTEPTKYTNLFDFMADHALKA